MKLYQHVYGRVRRGYATGRPGDQLAALSPRIEREISAVAQLNRLSFFPSAQHAAAGPRYSFFRPTPELVAFGASRWARNRSGTTGAFAHHFVGEASALIESNLTPVELLSALRPYFLDGEDALGDDRRLGMFDTAELAGPGANPAGSGDASPWEVLDVVCATPRGKSPLAPTPMVVLSAAAVWPFLHDVFRRLHPQRAAETTFSTLFVEATAFAADFRFVIVSDRRPPAGPGSAAFRVLDYSQSSHAAHRRRRYGAYVEFCRRHPYLVWEARRFFDLSHRQPDALSKGGPLLDTVLRTSTEAASAFRVALEAEGVPSLLLRRLLLADSDRALRHWRRGESVAYDDVLDEVVWEDARVRLPALLGIAADGQHRELRDDAFAKLAARIRTVPAASAVLHALDPPLGRRYAPTEAVAARTPAPRAVWNDRPNLEAFVAYAVGQPTDQVLGLASVVLPRASSPAGGAATDGSARNRAPTVATNGVTAVRRAVARRLCDELAARLLKLMNPERHGPDERRRASGNASSFGPVEIGLRVAVRTGALSDFVAAALALLEWKRQRPSSHAPSPDRRRRAVTKGGAGVVTRLRLASYNDLDRRQYRALLQAAAPGWTHWDRTTGGPVATLRHTAHREEFERWALGRRAACSFSDQVALLVDLCRLRGPDDPCEAIVSAIARSAARARLARGVLDGLASDDPMASGRSPAPRQPLRASLESIANQQP